VEQPVEVSLEEAFNGTTRILQMTDSNGQPRRLEAKIPPGVQEGSRVRMAGQGMPAAEVVPLETCILPFRFLLIPSLKERGMICISS